MNLSIGLKEWAGVVEALGAGQQTMVVRIYEPKVKDFYLYPTYNYLNVGSSDAAKFDARFQEEYRDQALKAGLETMKRGKEELYVDLRYHAKIEDVHLISSDSIWKELKSHYIWAPEHIVDYASRGKQGGAYLWIVRTYKFPETVVIGRWNIGGPPDYHRHNENISTTGSRPVLSDEEFLSKKKQILEIIERQTPVAGKRK